MLRVTGQHSLTSEAILVGNVVHNSVQAVSIGVAVRSSNGTSVIGVFTAVLRVAILVLHVKVKVVWLWTSDLRKEHRKKNNEIDYNTLMNSKCSVTKQTPNL